MLPQSRSEAWGGAAVLLLLVACAAFVVAPAGAVGEPETAAGLVQALVARERSLHDLQGHLLDRSYLSPWAAIARGGIVRTVTIGEAPVAGGGHAGAPVPPEPEKRAYGVAFGEFLLGPAYSRYDVLVLRANKEKLWEIGGSVSLSMAGAVQVNGGQPGREEPRCERVVILQREGKRELRRASPQGSLGVTIQGGGQEQTSAVQQSPLADLLFGTARPTLGQALLTEVEAVQVAGPERRDEQEQYRLTARLGDPVSAWQVWLCPAWGYAPTEITQWQNPARERNLPAGTQRLARRWVFSDFRQLADALWLPHKVVFFEFFYSSDTPEKHSPLARIHEITLYGLAVNTNPDPTTWEMPSALPPATDDALAALQATFPALAEHPDWLTEAAESVADPKMPEPPEDLLNWTP